MKRYYVDKNGNEIYYPAFKLYVIKNLWSNRTTLGKILLFIPMILFFPLEIIGAIFFYIVEWFSCLNDITKK